MQNSPVIPKALDKTADFLSPSSLSNPFAALIIFFASTQLGLHFWPLSSLVYGIRIDYLSPTLYFLDLLILIYLFFLKSKNLDLKSLVLLAPILLTNLLYSSNPISTLSWSLHLVLYLAFLWSVSKSNFKNILAPVLMLSLFFQAILATLQVWLGHSVGSLLYYLGERTVAVGAPTIALATFMGNVVLRAYGTFGHPNVLAGWAVICLLILLRLKSNISKLVPATVLVSLLVILTQSRAAALSLFGFILPFYLIKNLKPRIIYFCIFAFVYLCIFPSYFSPPRSDLSLSDRLSLQGASLKIIADYPLFGTGTQASISTYPQVTPNLRLLQPDHDSFSLFLSWYGFFGVLAFLFTLKSRNLNLKSSVYLLPLFLLDHYLLTSPQGLFILLLYFSVALNYSHD